MTSDQLEISVCLWFYQPVDDLQLEFQCTHSRPFLLEYVSIATSSHGILSVNFNAFEQSHEPREGFLLHVLGIGFCHVLRMYCMDGYFLHLDHVIDQKIW